MAMYLGSFANGLFSGAQSAAQLYSMYQGIRAQQDQVEAAEEAGKIREDEARDKNIEGVVGRLRQQYGTPGQENQQAATAPSQQASAPPVNPTPVNTQRVAATGIGSVLNQPKPLPTPPLPVPPPALPPAEQQVGPPQPPPPVSMPTPPQPPSRTPGLTQIPPLYQEQHLQSQIPVPQPPPQVTTSQVLRAPIVEAQSPQRSPALVQLPVSDRVPNAAGPGNHYDPIRQEWVPDNPPPQPSVTEPVGGYFGRGGPAATQQPRPPVIPPYQQPPSQGGSGGSVGIGGTPLAQAEQPSIAGRVLSTLRQFNPIGSAQAAGFGGGPGAPPAPPAPVAPATPPVPPVPAVSPAPTPAATPPGPYRAYGDNVNVDPPQPTGITPANPPSTPPAQTPPAPVAVTGQGGKVAPGQQGPSVQSESTPTVTAPPVSPSAWDQLVKKDPALARMVEETIAETGSGISKYDVAGIIMRESGGNPSAVGGAGRGLMQIEPGAQKEVDPEMKLDPFNPKDNLRLGIGYMKHLAVDQGLGTGSFQMHVAYMRGPGGLARLQQIGWDAWSKENPIAAKGVLGLYDGKVTPTPAMFAGSGKQMTADGIVKAAESGPDGLLRYVADNGPPGGGMSDRWRMVQAKLEMSAARSGRLVEMAGPIQDWVAQQAHQGAVSNLLSAYQALAAGNGIGAATALAKSHAFFPDDSYGRFGVDAKGQVWATQFSETTGEPLGKPFMITPDMLAQQVLTLQNPRNFVEVLQKYQSTNADIVLKKAHADYYKALPGIAADKQNTALEIAGLKASVDREKAAGVAGVAAAKEEARNTRVGEIDKEVGEQYASENMPPNTDPALWATQSEIDKILRMPSAYGGAQLGNKIATQYASKLISTNDTDKGGMELARVQTKQGGAANVIRDRDTGQVRGMVSDDMATRLMSLPGIRRMAGAEVVPPKQPAQRANASPVGVGASTQTALNAGYNRNPTGLPTPERYTSQAAM